MSDSIRNLPLANPQQLEHKMEQLLSAARQYGATSAEARINLSRAQSVDVRFGEVETLEYHQNKSLSIVVYIGQKTGSASTRDFSDAAILSTVKAACDIARYTAEDEFTGLADAELMAKNPPDLDVYHPWDLTTDEAIALAIRCEQSALTFDKRITNSNGASVGWGESTSIYGNTHGFIGHWLSSRHSVGCSIIAQAGENAPMQRGGWSCAKRDSKDLETPERIGQIAAERALKHLSPRSLTSRTVPVLFTPLMAYSLMSHFLSAINGSSLYRQSSFLSNSLGTRVFPEFMHLYEQPHILKGLGSAPFDGEGVATHARDIVHNGTVQGYVLDSYSARKLGMQTTGNAGGVHNILVDSNTSLDFEGLLKEMGTGLVVTELMGMGVSIVTGHYSRGAAGFWVENGEIQYPVHEITIASQLPTMFKQLQLIGSDIEMLSSFSTGSWLIESMTIGGN